MSNPSELRPEDWFAKADHDLLSNRNNLAAVDVPWDTVCFHAQQAAEKYLKGFLVFSGATPPKIHDLRSLLVQCRKHDSTLEVLAQHCERLTRLGWVSRYPDVPGEPAEAEAREAAALADTICDAIRQRTVPQTPPAADPTDH